MRTRLHDSFRHIDTDAEPPWRAGSAGPPGAHGDAVGCADARIRCTVASMFDQVGSDAAAPWLADAAFLPADIDDVGEVAPPTAPTEVTVPAYRRVANRVAQRRKAHAH